MPQASNLHEQGHTHAQYAAFQEHLGPHKESMVVKETEVLIN